MRQISRSKIVKNWLTLPDAHTQSWGRMWCMFWLRVRVSSLWSSLKSLKTLSILIVRSRMPQEESTSWRSKIWSLSRSSQDQSKRSLKSKIKSWSSMRPLHSCLTNLIFQKWAQIVQSIRNLTSRLPRIWKRSPSSTELHEASSIAKAILTHKMGRSGISYSEHQKRRSCSRSNWRMLTLAPNIVKKTNSTSNCFLKTS